MFARVILFSLLLLTSLNVFAASQKTVEEFLAEQKIVRVLIDDSPGFGDQSATANAMNHLRQLGFTGKFDVIYGRVTAAKVSAIFNLPKDLPDIYEDKATNTTFYNMKAHFDRLNRNTIEQVNVGLSVGKNGGPCGVAEEDGLKVDESSMICDNNANFVNAKTFLNFNPYFSEQEPSDIDIINQGHSVEYQQSWNKFFVFPQTTLEDADIYLHKNPVGQTVLTQKPGFEALIDGIWNHTFNVMPVYGYTVQSNVCNQYNDEPGCFPGNILEIITAARYAQLNGPLEMRKPLIIPVFYDYEKDAETILQLINSDNWGEYEITGAENERIAIKQLALRNAFSIANINDANTNARIKALKPGDIMLLTLGALPKVIFDGIYTHTDTNIWPQIREGASSFNNLVLTGKPHFRCGSESYGGWEIGFDLSDDTQFKNQMNSLYGKNGICGAAGTWQNNPEIYRTIGEMLIAAQDPRSALTNYFLRLQTEALKPENDRIRYMLEEDIKLLATNHS